MIDQKNACGTHSGRQGPNPRLNGGTHPLLIVGVEDKVRQCEGGVNLPAMVPHDDRRVSDPCGLNSPQHVFEKGPPFELEERFGPAHHPFRLPRCQYYGGNQWERAYMKVFTAIRYE